MQKQKDLAFRFHLIANHREIPRLPWTVWLIHDRWDDWFTFQTQYWVWMVDGAGDPHELGWTKIGFRGQENGGPNLPPHFDELDQGFFSLGQSDDYYDNLNRVSQALPDFAPSCLRSLRDLALDLALFESVKGEAVVRRSLLRAVHRDSVKYHYANIANGGARLTPFEFTYQFPQNEAELTIDVSPTSFPPSNIHVVIGRNGVGKTLLLTNFLSGLSTPKDEPIPKRYGSFKVIDYFQAPSGDPRDLFNRVLSISFSAFDSFTPSTNGAQTDADSNSVPLVYVGLRKRSAPGGKVETKSTQDLRLEFLKHIRVCLTGPRRKRLEACLKLLMSDPVFQEVDPLSLLDSPLPPERHNRTLSATFDRLSSGHKIVWLTLVHMIVNVEERTLVLFDEPEAHLHPPLLSAFIRSLEYLLRNRNGVALIATHSPVILQEIPQSCAWIIRRAGKVVEVDHPIIETFAENAGTLTREVFGLEVTKTGYHRMLEDATKHNDTFDEVLKEFHMQVGQEGQALIRMLLAQKKHRKG